MTLSNVTYVHYQDVLGTNAKNQVSGISLYFIYAHYMDVSENSGIPISSILIGFAIINHPFWGTPIFGNTHMIHRS